MRRVYSTMMMLAMMVAALSFTACGGDDDDNRGGSADTTNSYIQVKIDGKTYKEAIPEWIYSQVDPLGTDSQGKKLTYTYDMIAHFENNGFKFMFGIVHYRNKEDLLVSPKGNYPFARDISDNAIYNNLAFTCLYEQGADEYNAVRGTHLVNSIEREGSNVRVEGSFTAVFEYGGDTKNIQGNYSIRIPF